MAPRVAPPRPGDRRGGFELQERIHGGGMATIWRVTRPGATGAMVMKIPRLRDADDPSFVLSFEVEQMILSRLSGPHVPRFIAAGDFPEDAYLVMERIPGTSVDAISRHAPLPAREVAAIGLKAAVALHDVHRQHVLHLDVSPDNILMREDGEAVLVDFGLARHEHLPDLMAEEFPLPIGTGPYISPEQILGVRSDPRSDLFALGVVLYLLATGELPFGDPKSRSGLRRRIYRRPPPPRLVNPACPDWLQEVILRCLEPAPDDRFPTAAQLAFALGHPEQIELTERAARATVEGPAAGFLRWLRFLRSGPAAARSAERLLAAVPIVMAAVDLSPKGHALAALLREAVAETLRTEPNARLTCVTVRKSGRLAIDMGVDAEGHNLHVRQLGQLRQWAQPLGLSEDRISFHVLESPDPARALVDYVRRNGVDLVVVGARGVSALRRFLGSVSARVVAEAPCSVLVVRPVLATEAPETP